MQAKAHYDDHLARFYAWSVGEIESKIESFESLLTNHKIYPSQSTHAIDLGAGHGVQSLALKKAGFKVTAVDFCSQLLEELRSHPNGDGIDIVESDLRKVCDLKHLNPEVIVCCGDTLTHLDNKEQIAELVTDCSSMLSPGGCLILSYRNYTTELSDNQRFIPVKSNSNKILTCILEYETQKVKVTDLFHEKINEKWIQRVSTYKKVRIAPEEVTAYVREAKLDVIFNEPIQGMQTLIARKPSSA